MIHTDRMMLNCDVAGTIPMKTPDLLTLNPKSTHLSGTIHSSLLKLSTFQYIKIEVTVSLQLYACGSLQLCVWFSVSQLVSSHIDLKQYWSQTIFSFHAVLVFHSFLRTVFSPTHFHMPAHFLFISYVYTLSQTCNLVRKSSAIDSNRT